MDLRFECPSRELRRRTLDPRSYQLGAKQFDTASFALESAEWWWKKREPTLVGRYSRDDTQNLITIRYRLAEKLQND